MAKNQENEQVKSMHEKGPIFAQGSMRAVVRMLEMEKVAELDGVRGVVGDDEVKFFEDVGMAAGQALEAARMFGKRVEVTVFVEPWVLPS
jgi:hypothetical protein